MSVITEDRWGGLTNPVGATIRMQTPFFDVTPPNLETIVLHIAGGKATGWSVSRVES